MNFRNESSEFYNEYNNLCRSMYALKKLTVPVRMLYVSYSQLSGDDFSLPDDDFFSIKATEYEDALNTLEYQIIPGINRIIRKTRYDRELFSLFQASRDFLNSCLISEEKIKQNLVDSTCCQLEHQLCEVS